MPAARWILFCSQQPAPRHSFSFSRRQALSAASRQCHDDRHASRLTTKIRLMATTRQKLPAILSRARLLAYRSAHAACMSVYTWPSFRRNGDVPPGDARRLILSTPRHLIASCQNWPRRHRMPTKALCSLPRLLPRSHTPAHADMAANIWLITRWRFRRFRGFFISFAIISLMRILMDDDAVARLSIVRYANAYQSPLKRKAAKSHFWDFYVPVHRRRKSYLKTICSVTP